jgi:hypothetical protein
VRVLYVIIGTGSITIVTYYVTKTTIGIVRGRRRFMYTMVIVCMIAMVAVIAIQATVILSLIGHALYGIEGSKVKRLRSLLKKALDIIARPKDTKTYTEAEMKALGIKGDEGW